MSEIKENEDFSTKLKDEQFLYFADNSNLGILIIQQGYIKYYNHKFPESFGYSPEEISQWKKREFFKIIHPDDLNQLLQNLNIEDDKMVSFRFRAITKSQRIVNIEVYLCIIRYNNARAYLISTSSLDEISTEEAYLPKKITINKKTKIILDYHSNVVKLLDDNNIAFEIIRNCSYREEQ